MVTVGKETEPVIVEDLKLLRQFPVKKICISNQRNQLLMIL